MVNMYSLSRSRYRAILTLMISAFWTQNSIAISPDASNMAILALVSCNNDEMAKGVTSEARDAAIAGLKDEGLGFQLYLQDYKECVEDVNSNSLRKNIVNQDKRKVDLYLLMLFDLTLSDPKKSYRIGKNIQGSIQTVLFEPDGKLVAKPSSVIISKNGVAFDNLKEESRRAGADVAAWFSDHVKSERKQGRYHIHMKGFLNDESHFMRDSLSKKGKESGIENPIINVKTHDEKQWLHTVTEEEFDYISSLTSGKFVA